MYFQGHEGLAFSKIVYERVANLILTMILSSKKAPFAKTTGKPNASILNFFKKVDSPLKDDSIFLSQGNQTTNISLPRLPTPDLLDTDDLYRVEEQEVDRRHNETGGSVKKRKLSDHDEIGDSQESVSGEHISGVENDVIQNIPIEPCTPTPLCVPKTVKSNLQKKAKKPRRPGPFLEDSESEYEDFGPAAHSGAVTAGRMELRAVPRQSENANQAADVRLPNKNKIIENPPETSSATSVDPARTGLYKPMKKVPVAAAQAKWEALQPKNKSTHSDVQEVLTSISKGKATSPTIDTNRDLPIIPALEKESTSIDEWADFDDLQDFPDDEFADGEEFRERKWMEEQAMLEGADDESFNGFEDDENVLKEEPTNEGITETCPICNASLSGVTPDLATRHVNGCLDGTPVPLPTPVENAPPEVKLMPPGANNRFAKKAAIARPGQANPFDLGSSEPSTSTAFSKLMSGKAEDAAWANAAAAEQASRGKPAYQRTCPFYKIMPGFFICVDAFRYGAVQGCNAYFLSHFHSDHYIGLTASWCHGPIYCSKVTANLVKQQLKVDPKWVVALNFEERFEIPKTKGVSITMIPANHCPGSSLFLFEKVLGRGVNPKVQRILHCGDFRACPAHVAHPLLIPDVVETISGRTKQQKIDVCYLDTTYLNPRYAFPSQEEVIKACADMCVSLKKERAEDDDAWEVIKRERAGTGMTKFINAAVKSEDDSIAMAIGSKKPRGRLLVVCGTYSIGKERICMGIARALDCKIYAPPGKMRICAALEDPELMSRMTSDPREAQIHMQMLMEIRPETLQDYLNGYKPHFSRIVGFRPSGWNYRPPASRHVFFSFPLPILVYSANKQAIGSSHPPLSPISSIPLHGSLTSPWRSSCLNVALLARHPVSEFLIVNILLSESLPCSLCL